MNEDILFSYGADWIKCDFHLHSPFVDSFTLPNGINIASGKDIERLVIEYIGRLKQSQIKICSITDYQQIRKDFFVQIQSRAREEGIYIFPGVELSISSGKGIHILIIFEYGQEIDGINDYIKSLDQNPQTPLIENRKHRDINPKEDLKLILQDIRTKFNCLIIFAHPEDDNGIVKEYQPKESAELLKHSDAIEYIDTVSIDKLISTGIIKRNFIENKFAIIENSDPKSIEEIGTKKRDGKVRCTYLKLSSVSIDAIRIAFQDPSMRVMKYNKPQHFYNNILNVKIEGGGFLKNVNLDFNRELNSLIGGRGVGKSAVVESIRYCLDLPVYSDQSFREDFIKNVVGSGGKITLKIERAFGDKKKTYEVSRIIGKEPQVKDMNYHPSEIFENKIPILIGQKELYHLAKNKEFQLNLMDQIIGDEIKKEIYEFNKLISQLNENKKHLLDLYEKLGKKEGYEQRLKTLDDHIKTFEDLGVAEKMKLNTKLISDEETFKNAIEVYREQYEMLSESINNAVEELSTAKNKLQSAVSPERQILIKLANYYEEIIKQLRKKQIEVGDLFKQYELKLNELEAEWRDKKESYDKDINEAKKHLSQKGLSPDRYEDLIKERSKILPLIGEFAKLEGKLKELLEQREKINKDLAEQRHKIFKVRQLKVEEINKALKGRVKLDVKFEGNKKQFMDDLRNLLYGSRIQIDSLKQSKIVIDGLALSKLIDEGKSKLKEKCGFTDATADRLINWFSDKDRQFKLETLFPDDSIDISLKFEDGYKEFSKLSDGQKATTLLILLFNQQDRILIIDQPEEDLDNRFVFDDVVSILREIKGKRQIILATHNANIPVLGDSEQIFVLEASKGEGCIISDYGSIDKKSIIENIKSIMEGGEEAFRLRMKKYGVKL